MSGCAGAVFAVSAVLGPVLLRQPDPRSRHHAGPRALARRNDQIVVVLGHAGRKGRGDMEHGVATRRRFSPTRVGAQIGAEVFP